jgi:Na+/proline symporter
MLAETTFRLPDYLVFAAYMASLVVVGFCYRKTAQKNLESYFLAERKMSGWK